MPTFLERVGRHVRLSRDAARRSERFTPPFLIVYVTSICNLHCGHCFFWRNLNKRNDLSFDEFDRLTAELGPIENLNLSGGEPFVRPDVAEIIDLFVTRNRARQVYVPTNGYLTGRIEKTVRKVLARSEIQLLVIEISLDGMPAYHDQFRGNPQTFARAMETYDMLARLQQEDQRLRIHAISTASHENVDEIRELTSHLFERCPKMDHHNLAIIRGDRRDPTLREPAPDAYDALYAHLRATWAPREKGRFGGIVDPLLNWGKRRTIDCQTQVVPCKAGRLTAVVYADGDVAFCEGQPPIGSLRDASFFGIWDSARANELRAQIAAKDCFCTNEAFMWPSIVFQPVQLAKSIVGAALLPSARPGARHR